MKIDYSIFINRSKELVQKIKQKHQNQKGLFLLFAAFENHKYKFRQDSTFYYYTGIGEPGVVLVQDLNANAVIYAPNYAESRAKWSISHLYQADKKTLESWGISHIENLGAKCGGYIIKPTCAASEYENLTKTLAAKIKEGYKIYTAYSLNYLEHNLIIDKLINILPELKNSIIDISEIMSSMRVIKSKLEIEKLYKAIDVTMEAHEAAAAIISDDMRESDVEAVISFMYTQKNAIAAFPSIVASGSNATILHYNINNGPLNNNDLVIVDIGAEVDYYCADLTRTYPVSGVYNKRQRELYNIVLDTQKYIEGLAKPGYYLNNKDKPSQSLQHLAWEYINKKGYGKYFTHGIGHFLGIDVHDVGDPSKPLGEGSVITIEPGIYIPEEKIGIRIEDNYWITNNGAVCLSEELPKEIHQIEEFMALSDEEEGNEA